MMGSPLPGGLFVQELQKEHIQQITQGLLQNSKTPDQCNTEDLKHIQVPTSRDTNDKKDSRPVVSYAFLLDLL